MEAILKSHTSQRRVKRQDTDQDQVHNWLELMVRLGYVYWLPIIIDNNIYDCHKKSGNM